MEAWAGRGGEGAMSRDGRRAVGRDKGKWRAVRPRQRCLTRGVDDKPDGEER